MSKLLYIPASPRGEASQSGAVAKVFLESYQAENPNADIDIMDIWAEPLPPYARQGAGAKMTLFSGGSPTGDEAKAWEDVQAVFDRFNAADHYLFAVPMWNASIPYVLKHLIDIITQPGLTFGFDPTTGYSPLLTGKKAAVVYTAGVQPQDDPAFGKDFQIPYFTDWLRSIGITDITNIEFRPTILTADAQAARSSAEAAARIAAKSFLHIAFFPHSAGCGGIMFSTHAPRICRLPATTL